MRRWQFSLRTVFAIVTLVATALGWYAWAGRFLEGFRPTLFEFAIYACPIAVLFVRREHRNLGLDFGLVQFGFCLSAATTAYFLMRAFTMMSFPLSSQAEQPFVAIVIWTFVIPVSLLIESLVLSRGISLVGLRWFHWFTAGVVAANIGLLTCLCLWLWRQLSHTRL